MPTSFCTIAFFPTSVGTVFPSSADLGVGKNRLKVPTPAHPVTALYFRCIPALYRPPALYYVKQFVQQRAQQHARSETTVSISISGSANFSRSLESSHSFLLLPLSQN